MGPEMTAAASNWLGDAPATITLGAPRLIVRGPARKSAPLLPGGVRGSWAERLCFLPQASGELQRTCGAAALAMALRSVNVPCTPEELWAEIACPDGEGELAARTHDLAAAALRRGMPALIIEVRSGWASLYEIARSVPAIILNQRLSADAWQGHFSVLADMNDRALTLHDPQQGPGRMLSRREFEELWRPRSGQPGEIAGHVLVAIGPRTARGVSCERCARPLPADATCVHCGHHFPLQPSAALGCLRRGCERRLWQKLFCPYCDAAFEPAA